MDWPFQAIVADSYLGPKTLHAEDVRALNAADNHLKHSEVTK
jgi:hypothetical protein